MPCRYGDGERLSAEDEKEVIEKLLTYHPHSEDKIGCGLDSIMVTYNLFMNVAYVLSLFILTFTTIVPTISTNMIFFISVLIVLGQSLFVQNMKIWFFLSYDIIIDSTNSDLFKKL